MEYLPEDPFILVSSINMLLRDGEFDSLEELCRYFGKDTEEVKSRLAESGFEYLEAVRQFR